MPSRLVRVSAVFATEPHARAATRTLIEWLDSGTPVALELVGGPDGVALVSFDIDPARREALLTLLRGLHGVPTPETVTVLAVAS